MTSHKYVWQTEGPRVAELTSHGMFPSSTGTSNLDDGFSEDTIMRNLENSVLLEEEGPYEGQSLGLSFLRSVSTITADWSNVL
jgi:hypothetical protein